METFPMKLTNKKLLAAAVLTAVGTQANAAPVIYSVTSSDVTMDWYFAGAYIGIEVPNTGPGTSSSDAVTAPNATYQGNELPSTGAFGFNISGTVTYDDTDGSVLDYNLLFNGGVVYDLGGGDSGYLGFLDATGDYINGDGLTLNQGRFDGTFFGADAWLMVDLSSPGSFDLSGNEILDGDGNSIPVALDFTEGSVFDSGLGFQNPGFIVEQDGPLDGSPIVITMPGFAGSTQPAVGNTAPYDFDVATMMGGSITLQPVPVPAAAWLFGSALLGLVGVRRKNKNLQ